MAEGFLLDSFKKTARNAKLFDFITKVFDPTKHNIYISGPVGSGKTHAATGLVIKCGGRVLKLYQILRLARRMMKMDGIDEGDLISLFSGTKISTRDFYEPPISTFVLDDLGSEKLTEFGESTLFEIIDSRMIQSMKGMIITSNLSLGALAERLGSDRIPSRLTSMCEVFNLEGERDGRMENTMKEPKEA